VPGTMVMETLADALKGPSLTVRVKPRTVGTETTGAVNWVALASGELSGTSEPDVCVHAKVRASPSGSVLAEPSSVTASPLPAIAGAAAAARGG